MRAAVAAANARRNQQLGAPPPDLPAGAGGAGLTTGGADGGGFHGTAGPANEWAAIAATAVRNRASVLAGTVMPPTCVGIITGSSATKPRAITIAARKDPAG